MFNLKIGILLSPSNSGRRSFRQIRNFSFEEPSALVHEVIGSNGAVELVPVNCQPVIGDVELQEKIFVKGKQGCRLASNFYKTSLGSIS